MTSIPVFSEWSPYPLAKYLDNAANQIKSYGDSSMSNEDLLLIYGLYKQATIGDINVPQPSFYQIEAKAKYRAWLLQKGKSKDQAKQEYVLFAMKFLPDSVSKGYQ